MTPLLFLLIAVGMSVVGSFALWLHYRQRPHSFESAVEEFSREMRALAPDQPSSADEPRR